MTATFHQLPRRTGRKPERDEGSLVAVVLLFLFALFPRLWILGFWIFGGMLGDAYSNWIVPAIGFFVAPWTTMLYAWMWAIGSTAVTGWEWAPVVVGMLLDLWFFVVLARIFVR